MKIKKNLNKTFLKRANMRYYPFLGPLLKKCLGINFRNKEE
jgi:hypothetical protein